MLGLFEIAKTKKDLEEAYALNKRIMKEYSSLEEENKKLQAKIKDLETELNRKSREIDSLKRVFKEFYQTIYEKVEQNRNLWVGFKISLDNVSIDNITLNDINSLVADSKEQKLTDTQIREMLKRHGIKYNG